ncbi:hypothetical protein ACVIKO_003864 [Rhizobium ruizarguesonis]
MGAVDIGNEMGARTVMEGGKRQSRHDGAEIRAADADIDDIGDRLAGRALQRPGADAVGKLAHGGKHGIDVGHDVLAVDQDRRVGAVAQCGVQNGAILGEVDRLAGEHFLALLLDAAVFGELHQELEDVVIHRRLGKIHQQVVKRDGKARKALRIGGEGGTDVGRLGGISGAFQLFDDGVHGRLLWRRKGCGNYSLYHPQIKFSHGSK